MLTEFLKSIRGEKALWETIITGVDVCNFRLQGNTKDPFIPISLQPLHFEVFFCFAGHVVLKQQWNRVVVVRKQEILLLSGGIFTVFRRMYSGFGRNIGIRRCDYGKREFIFPMSYDGRLKIEYF